MAAWTLRFATDRPQCAEMGSASEGKPELAQAKEILLLAFGENKTSTVAKAVEGPVTPAVPASFLQEHPNATFYLDAAASAGMNIPSLCCVPK